MTDPDRLAELDNLAAEFFGTHRYGSALARLLGITPSAVNQWRKGDSTLPESALVALRFGVRARRAESALGKIETAREQLRAAADLLAGRDHAPAKSQE